ncbi:hypothetical protein B9479_002736 [Cryptococcus floricola]|uniref:ER transporter 6TM N-terminal domain-containing protein n=1 Tax=Cryptococcus floricola TaxID=2591691 RepID=A0A5D3B1W5_9TREE|nr:hypothetical protein B9479_002736 [Cryptococcus floricola]
MSQEKTPEGVAKTKTSSKWTEKLHIPDWLEDSWTDRRQWKNFIRCMIATFAPLVLLVCQSSLNVIGQATFFAPLVSQMIPPYMALGIYLFVILTMVLGICFGWAWGAAAMAAAIRARSQVLLQSQVQAEQAGYNQSGNIELQYSASIFRGAFLDPRSSAVYGVFLFVGAYGLGFIRAVRPKLTLGSIASVILIFPQTLNHIVLDAFTKTIIAPCIELLDLQEQVLRTSPSDKSKWAELADKTYAIRDKHVSSMTALQEQIGMLQLEITRGQIGPTDTERIFDKSKDLGARLYSITSFVMLIQEQRWSDEKDKETTDPHPHHHTKKHVERLRQLAEPDKSLEGLLPVLADSSADLRESSIKALRDISDWLFLVNHTRWKKVPADSPPITQREENLENLKRALQEFRVSKQFALLEPFSDLFDPETGALKSGMLPSFRLTGHDLSRALVLTATIVPFALSLIALLELLLEIERANPKAKIQFPKRFAKMLLKTANDKNGNPNPLDMGLKDTDAATEEERGRASPEEDDDSDDEDQKHTKPTKKQKSKKTYAKDPDARDPRNSLQHFGRHVYTVWQGLSGTSGVFALKYALVSVALFVPSVCPSSAHFYYVNRGLWALIMSQTGLGVFTGEQINAFIVRMSGTVTGLVIGMLAWYIGSGHGNGNPYGVTAATMVLIAPFLFIRIAAPQSKAVFFLMANVTVMLVVGYSWIDGHMYTTASQGVGAALAGRRALLVIIGFTAAFICMLFPRPTSARALFRRRLAKNMRDISELYGEVVTGIEDEVDAAEWGTEVDENGRRERYKGKFMNILGRMEAMKVHMMYASLEIGLKGPWPKKTYAKLYKVQNEILVTLALLSSAYSRLEVVWCKRLATRSLLMHPAFIGDCLMLFSALQQSLRTGEPLPPMLPIFERLAMHESAGRTIRRQWMSGTTETDLESEAFVNGVDGESENVNEVRKRKGSDRADRVSEEGTTLSGSVLESDNAAKVMAGLITWENCNSEQFTLCATSSTSLVHITVCLNKMYLIVRELVGERDLGGLDRASARWADMDPET